MLIQRPRGFSLLELMVAVLIVSVLAAMSGPVYRSYTSKSKFAEAFKTISMYRDDLAVAYVDSDQFPASVTGVPLNTYTTITSPALKLLYYNRSTDKQAAYMHFYTLDLGVDSYAVISDLGAGGAKCRITLAAVATAAGQIQYYCGQWDATSLSVPLANLPKTCQDTNISALIT